MARLITLVIPITVLLAACQKEDPRYCAMFPGQDGCPDASPPGPECSSKTDCLSAERPACDTMQDGGTCVVCTATDRGACTGTTPVCDSNRCVACTRDTECLGGVCLPDGTCPDATTVIHAVANGGLSTTGCGLPGVGACTLDQALADARSKPRTVIKLDDAASYAGTNFIVEPGADIILDLRVGATLTRRGGADGAVITVNGNGTSSSGKLTLLRGTISGGHGTGTPTGDGVACTMGGTVVLEETRITANDASAINTSNCTVTITHAQIDGNNPAGAFAAIRSSGGSVTLARSTIQNNRGGGLDITGAAKFTVVGNVFVGNGDSNSNVGGVSINATSSGNRLEFNSIAQNKSQAGAGGGVSCMNADFIASGNIIWNNNSGGIQASGNCKHSYSDIGPIFPLPLDAANNRNMDPRFANDGSDLHLTNLSPFDNLMANPQADLSGVAALDIDDAPRTAPATMGADQPAPK